MENEKKINWLGLFIKIVIVFIFALIIVWLISKIVGRNKLSETFINNINNMEKVSIEYYKTIDLPLIKGKSTKITLEEMIEKKIIVSVNSDSENTCDIKESYSKITREKNKYVLETTLKCGKEKDTIKTDFSLKECKNCNQENAKTENNKIEENTNKEVNNSKEQKPTNNKNENQGITYYEHVKETTEYTKWMVGSKSGDNIENKYEYYGIDYQTYYTLGVLPADKNSVTYTLKLDKVPNKKYYFTTIEEVNNFNKSEETKYLNEKNISLYKENKISVPTKDISKYCLCESNFTYKLSPYYRKGEFYVRVTITLNNKDGVDTYYDNKLQKDAYLIPLKLNIKFASNEVTETKPTGKYEIISYYRYVTIKKDTIWSIESKVDGYTKTGNTKIK